MEKERELEVQKKSEQARKLTKVASIKIRKDQIGHDRVDEDEDAAVVRPAFRDPLQIKEQQFQAAVEAEYVSRYWSFLFLSQILLFLFFFSFSFVQLNSIHFNINFFY